MYEREFVGMLREPVALSELEAVRGRLLDALRADLTESDVAFLLSFKRGEPDWDVFAVQGICKLPAVRWKLHNLTRMTSPKRKDALSKLEHVLEEMRQQRA